ncbi:hypothetical protein CFO_g5504 [Ceratocystis platani]|uniref:Uncharacterized protein n=1 Tax=Ceratocystis fimbriata f. sp. platani TaxID=88771 RepID=A0A0F8D7Q2_CERFI|nr:hypothetical protein CFO_g5504 [Ceratocystis platani]
MAPYDIRSMALETLPFVLVETDDRDQASFMTLEFQKNDMATDYRHHMPQQQQQPASNPQLHHDHDHDDVQDDSLAAAQQPQSQEQPAQDPGAPSHPVDEMQAAFSESLIEATHNPELNKPTLREFDPKIRRQRLIEQPKSEALPYTRWRYRPGQKQHELWKLMAQISFGVYLLLNGRSNSIDQVISILQGHIDDIDEFLEVSLEDLSEAARDLNSRIQHLCLPMENRQVFEKLLEDRNFRAELMSGSETIEHVIARTTLFLDQCDDDIFHGFNATRAFSNYLGSEADASWREERPGVLGVFEAMVNNTEGWQKTFITLEEKAKELNELIVSLTQMVADMQRIAAEVSRRTWISIEPFTGPLQGQAAAHMSHISQASYTSPPSSFSKDSQSVRSHGSTQPSVSRPTPSTSSISQHPGDGALTPPPDARFNTQLGLDDQLSADNESEPERETTTASPDNEAFLLQPSVYTPKVNERESPISPPESHASPPPPPQEPEMLLLSDKRYSKNHPPSSSSISASMSEANMSRTSLRQRISLKGHAPNNIHIPPPQRQTSAPVNPYQRQQLQQMQQQQRISDSAFSASMEHQYYNQPTSSIHSDMSPGLTPPQLLIPSPQSEVQQSYHPVLASPHSPLQQRPHTSHNTPRFIPNTPQEPMPPFPASQRNVPSRVGGGSTLSVGTAMTYDTTNSDGTHRQVKKKKSKFGWLKKAFQLDEEEKAAFEARRQMNARNLYYEDRSGQFLDGRRIR